MLVNKAFTDLLTFSRGSGGWYFNSTGILVQAANDAPRFDYDPMTLQPRGLLIEEGRSNLITYSAALDNAAWSKSNCTVTAGAALAPDGTMSAGKIVGASGASSRYVASAAATATNALVAGSIFAKAAGYSKFRLNLTNFSSDSRGVYVDLAAGSIYQTDSSGSDFTGISGSVSPIGGGWYRCVVLALKGSANSVVRLAIDPKDNAGASAGDGTSGIYAWGGQVELGGFHTSYIATTAATVARATDSASIASVQPWFNQPEGTIYLEADHTPRAAPLLGLADFWEGSSERRLLLYKQSSGVTAQIYGNGSQQAVFGQASPPPDGQPFRAAFAYRTGDAAMSVDGGVAIAAAPASLQMDVSRLVLGAFADGGGVINGHVRSLRYYPRRLSNSELQALTAA